MNETIALLETISGRRLEVERTGAVAGDQRRTKADTTRIHADLGWQPRPRSRTAFGRSGAGRR